MYDDKNSVAQRLTELNTRVELKISYQSKNREKEKNPHSILRSKWKWRKPEASQKSPPYILKGFSHSRLHRLDYHVQFCFFLLLSNFFLFIFTNCNAALAVQSLRVYGSVKNASIDLAKIIVSQASEMFRRVANWNHFQLKRRKQSEKKERITDTERKVWNWVNIRHFDVRSKLWSWNEREFYVCVCVFFLMKNIIENQNKRAWPLMAKWFLEWIREKNVREKVKE